MTCFVRHVEVRSDQRSVVVFDFDFLDGSATGGERVADNGTHLVDGPLVGTGEFDEQVARISLDFRSAAVDDRREREQTDIVVDGWIAVVLGNEVRVLLAGRVGAQDLVGGHLGVRIERDESVAIGFDADVANRVAALLRGRTPFEHRQVVNPDCAFRTLATHRRVEFLLELDERVERFLAEIYATDDCAGDVGSLLGDASVHFDGPIRIVQFGNVDAAVVAVLVAKRARHAFDGQAVEAVRGELQLHVAVLGVALVFEAEAEHVLFQFVVALLVVAGQSAQFVGVDIDSWHQ